MKHYLPRSLAKVQDYNFPNQVPIMTKPRRNLPAKVLQYSFVVIPFLILMLFALEPFYTSTSIIINILLGGLLCLLIELYIFSRLYRKQLEESNFSVVKTIIKQFNRFWGDKTPQFLDYRNQKKYYIPCQSTSNNLFKPKGDFVYTKAMTELRGKLTVDYMPKIKQIQTKCQYVQQRTVMIQRIYQSIVQDYSDTSKGLLYVLYNIRKQISQESKFLGEYTLTPRDKIRVLMQKVQHNVGLPPSDAQVVECLSWNQTSNMVSLMGNSLHKTEKEVNELCYKLTTALASDAKSVKNSIIEKLRKLYSNHKKGESDCLELTNRIKLLEEKIKQLVSGLQKAKKKPQNYENQLNIELDVKINKSEVSSLNVRLWNLKDVCTIQAEQLFNQCQSSHKSIINMESTLEANAQTIFKTFLETQRQSIYDKIRYIRKILEKHQPKPNDDQSVYYSVNNTNNLFNEPKSDPVKFALQYQKLIDSKTKQILFYKTFFQGISQVFQKRLAKMDSNYQVIQKQLSRIGGVMIFERWTMKHFYGEIQSTKTLVGMLKEMNRNARVKVLKFERDVESFKTKQLMLTGQLSRTPFASIRQPEKKRLVKAMSDIITGLEFTKMQDDYTQLEFIFPFTQFFVNSLQSIQQEITIMEGISKADEPHGSEADNKFREYYSLLNKIGPEDSGIGNHPNDISVLNNLIGVFLHDWKHSQAFHHEVTEKLWLPFNRKRPQFLDEMKIKYLKIEQIFQQEITNIRFPKSQIFHFVIDFDLMIRGKVGLTIESKIKINKGVPVKVKGRINRGHLNMRLSFTPWAVGKSYFSFLAPPKLDITTQIIVGKYNISKIPLMGLFVKIFLIRVFKNILVWPMRASITIPGSIRDTRAIAVKQRLKWQHEQSTTRLQHQEYRGSSL